MADFLQFSKNIRRRGRQVENSATRLVKRMAKRSLRSLVLNTKVDTGEARSNWRVGIGGLPTAVIKPYSPYPKGSKANGQGISESENANATISAGEARIDAVRGVSGVGLKTAIYIVNNAPHIDKALLPGAFEISIREAQSEVRGFRIFNRSSEDDE